MKLSVVFLIVLGVLVFQSQAQSYSSRGYRKDDFEEHDKNGKGDDDDDDRDSSKLPIPIISDEAADAIVKGSELLAEALKVVVENEVYDKTEVLTHMRSLLMDVNSMLNVLFTKVSGAVTNRITRSRGPEDPLSELISTVKRAAKDIKEKLIRTLERKIKPSELSDIINALNDIVERVENLNVFKPKSRSPFRPFQFDESFDKGDKNDKGNDKDKDKDKDKDDYHYHEGLDLETVISEWATAVEGLAKAVKILAKAIQKAISSRTLAIMFQKSVQKSLSISASGISSVSTKLNSALESVKTTLGMFSQTTLTQINQSYSSITSNPNKWHHRLLSKLFDFLASYSGYVHKEYLHTIASSVKRAELEIASKLIRETRKTGFEISDIAIYITDRAASSSNPRATSECSLKQLQKLNPSSLSRLSDCLTNEASNIRSMTSQGKQLLTLAKDNAVNIVTQLSVCNSGTDKCYQQFSDVFDGKKERAKEDLKSAAEQTERTLKAITGRIDSCLEAVAEEILTEAKKCRKNFDFCMKF
ncbi:uncharacterized protein LOC5568349 [Aedes aegypti]|uniref:Uncharacterized protein n=1 Tax=Aedes aegypti TaxID=7159 RepID=A0A1S4EXP4_AEDAE|nr:uncharacterized protein LOC5568349 [Aedes aegypti]